MNKSSIAASVLCAIGVGHASAETGVTLYGVIDQPVEYVNRVAQGSPTVTNGALVSKDGGSRAALTSNGALSGSRWGVRGSEDLGGELKAIFALESGFAPDTGALQRALFARQAYVGLSSSYGSLTFGRQYTPMFDTLANFGPARYAPLYEPQTVLNGLNFRSDNSVKYTGVFGPINAEAYYSFGNGVATLGLVPLANAGAGESPGNPRDNIGYGAGLSYINKNFGAAVTYDEWNPTVIAGQPGKVRKFAGALSYTAGNLKLMGGYKWEQMSYSPNASFARDDYFWAGGSYQMSSALSLMLGYYYMDIKSLRLSPSSQSTNPANPWQALFVADYSLSKRSDLYLSVAYARNAGLGLDTAINNFSNGYAPATGQTSMFGVAVGLRHVF